MARPVEGSFDDRFVINKDTNCWEWTRGLTYKGYASYWFSGEPITGHRFSYARTFGAIPANLQVLHKCDNRKCVNPDHLFLGTNYDNTQDRVKKNRSCQGVKHKDAKLDEQIILLIREQYMSGNYSKRAIARGLGVSHTCVINVLNNKTWKHLNGQ